MPSSWEAILCGLVQLVMDQTTWTRMQVPWIKGHDPIKAGTCTHFPTYLETPGTEMARHETFQNLPELALINCELALMNCTPPPPKKETPTSWTVKGAFNGDPQG